MNKPAAPKRSKATPQAAAPTTAEAAPAKSKPAPRSRASSLPASSPPAPSFPIVGIGASAGGLEALEQFLSGVPLNSGMAYVVVQHLDPNHKGMLTELLQRATPMPVQQITERMPVRPNQVYVIAPGYDLSILHGVLHLLESAAPRGLRLPIDYFLRSLAADQKERSVGVILSGMGADGTLGLRAIKACAGAAFVQAPESAKFDGMPRSAINAGLADVVAPAQELAARIITFIKHLPLLVARSEVAVADTDQSGLEKVVLLLRTQTGHDFSLYKTNTLYRRIERRMALHQLTKMGDYVRFLRSNPTESDLLFKELLIGVTSFFRDPAVWEQMAAEVIPALLAAHPEGGTLRAWVPACSTGEEAYTLAMVFRDTLEQLKPSAHYALQLFATDLDPAAIDRARVGVFPANIAADVSEARLQRYFEPDNGGYRLGKEIREMVIFATHNLVMDPPFTKLDILSCRNLLIYLEGDLQKKLLPLFHYSLNPGGVLVLGSAETVGSATELFAPMAGKTRIYRRRETVQQVDSVEFPAGFALRRALGSALAPLPFALPAGLSAPNLQQLTETILLQSFAPAAVLATDQGDLVYISGKTGSYLEPAAGKINSNLIAMARPGLAVPLQAAFTRAVRHNKAVVLHAVQVGNNGGTQTVDVTVQPLAEPQALRTLVLVAFVAVATPVPEVAAPGARQPNGVHAQQVDALSRELQQSRHQMQALSEEMQSSQEELKSANEELQSTNEELQSTNEELTTSKEEMQSMNEELQTVNHELNAKVTEMSLVSDDMKNLLNSTDIATLFLDKDLRVRRFTTQATHLINLIPGDVGRPITDLVTLLDYPAMRDDAREVLRSLVFHEVQVATKDKRWFSVRTMPYRTQDNRIDGVVITFSDISTTKALEGTMNEAQAVLQGRFDNQGAQLDRAQALEAVVKQAQAVLEGRFAVQTKALQQSRADLQTERALHQDAKGKP